MPNNNDYAARKQREDEFFDALTETGNYEVYEEYEFDEPLEGLTEEPVVEEILCEESTKLHLNFDPRKKVKVTIK